MLRIDQVKDEERVRVDAYPKAACILNTLGMNVFFASASTPLVKS